jgi:hypothetical protein
MVSSAECWEGVRVGISIGENWFKRGPARYFVMPGLVPGIHVFNPEQDVDGRALGVNDAVFDG